MRSQNCQLPALRQIRRKTFLQNLLASAWTPYISRWSCYEQLKREQQLNATDRNIVGRNMLRAFSHPIATCCDMLRVEIELVRMPRRNIVSRTWPNDYKIMQHPQMLHEKFDHFQIWANNTQPDTTRRNRVAKRTQHNVAICCVEM